MKNSLMGQLKDFGFNTVSPTFGSSEEIHFDMEDIVNSPFALPMQNNDIKDNVQNPIKKDNQKILKKRINDLDANILQDSAFINIEDADLRLDEKIKKIQILISKTDEKISLIQDRDTSATKEKLLEEKQALVDVLNILTSDENLNVDKTVKQSFTIGKVKLLNNLHKKAAFINELENKITSFMYKFFPEIYKGVLMKKALNKLVALNKTTGELMSKQIPYGESDDRYDAIISYLASANTIHAKLIKKI